MACSPLPPRKRKPGSVGVAAGAEMAIMDDTGRLLSAGNIGEIVVRGDSSSSANQIPAAFHIFNLNEESRFSHRTLTTELRSRETGAIARVLGLVMAAITLHLPQDDLAACITFGRTRSVRYGASWLRGWLPGGSNRRTSGRRRLCQGAVSTSR